MSNFKRTLTKSAVTFGVLLITSASLNAASFNCKKAESLIEHTICNDDKLSKLDEELAKAYKNATQYTDENSLKKEQITWIKIERAACKDTECLKRIYAQRIDQLFDYSANKNNGKTAEVNLESTKQEAPVQTAPPVAVEIPVVAVAPVASLPEVTADSIASAYSENTIAADLQFKGKKFKVTGIVTDINTDFMGKPYITLQSSVNRFMKPQFSFEESEVARLANLKKGSTVSIICIGKGDVAKTPMSGSCTFL